MKKFLLFVCHIAIASAVFAQPEVHYLSGRSLPDFYVRLAVPDTVTVAEMKAGFQRMDTVRHWWSVPLVYDGIDEQDDRCALLFVRSPLEGCPLLSDNKLEARLQPVPADSSTGYRRQYVLTGLRHRSTGGDDAALLDKVAQRYGTSDVAGGALMPWLDGTYVCLQQPLRYFGFTVSGVRRIMQLRRGCVSDWGVSQTCRSLYERYAFESTGRVRTGGHWAQDITGSMRLLSFESRRWVRPDTSLNVRRPFTLLFVIDARGRLDVEVLKPHKLSTDDSRYISELQKAVRQLPAWSLRQLYASDGRVFPGRYVEAYRYSDRWTFYDCLQYGYGVVY